MVRDKSFRWTTMGAKANGQYPTVVPGIASGDLARAAGTYPYRSLVHVRYGHQRAAMVQEAP